MRIPVSQISVEWYDKYPVWTWSEDEDESLIEPVSVGHTLPRSHSSLFVKAIVTFANGIQFPGALSIRCSDEAVYAVSVFVDTDEYIFDLISRDFFQDELPKLANQLKVQIEEILPLAYSAPFRFKRSKDNIKGTVDQVVE
jgi:hypothetical protein